LLRHAPFCCGWRACRQICGPRSRQQLRRKYSKLQPPAQAVRSRHGIAPSRSTLFSECAVTRCGSPLHFSSCPTDACRNRTTPPHHTTPADTTIIFDWDDTLLSSSWLAQNGLRLDEPAVVPLEAMAQLEVLQESVISLVQRALVHGNVIVITNAETGWVELSCKKFMPRVLPLLSKFKVLSARSTFECLYPDSPSDWKVSGRVKRPSRRAGGGG
jgi:hypothetical protein